MRAAIQHPSLLIGTEEAIEKLAQKDNATVLVAADSHGAINTLERILREKGRQCDAFIFCGDGMSDLCRCLEKQIVDKHFCACIPPVVAVVEGNNDSDLHPMINPESRGPLLCGDKSAAFPEAGNLRARLFHNPRTPVFAVQRNRRHGKRRH